MNKLLTVMLASLLALPAAAKPTYILFDPSGVGDSYSLGINAEGTVAGEFGSDIISGFLRHPDGSIETFAAHDAARTSPLGLNDSGQTAGIVLDSTGQHGFLRQPDGTITLIDEPDGDETAALAINNGGVVAGSYVQGQGERGFVRDAGGAFQSFYALKRKDATEPHAINDAGAVTGFVIDNRHYHGFIRAADGTITVFDAQSADDGFTNPLAIAEDGTIVGYSIPARAPSHGFVRHPDGTVEIFDPPGSTGTIAYGINRDGVIVGTFSVEGGGGHAFIRRRNGTFKVFDYAPKHGVTGARAINASGAIAGELYDAATSERRALLRLP